VDILVLGLPIKGFEFVMRFMPCNNWSGADGSIQRYMFVLDLKTKDYQNLAGLYWGAPSPKLRFMVRDNKQQPFSIKIIATFV
jgi:hypothetical protein